MCVCVCVCVDALGLCSVWPVWVKADLTTLAAVAIGGCCEWAWHHLLSVHCAVFCFVTFCGVITLC